MHPKLHFKFIHSNVASNNSTAKINAYKTTKHFRLVEPMTDTVLKWKAASFIGSNMVETCTFMYHMHDHTYIINMIL